MSALSPHCLLFSSSLRRIRHFQLSPRNRGRKSNSISSNGFLPGLRCSQIKSRLRYDKLIPEEIIENPVGILLEEKDIGSSPRCMDCNAKGAVLCATCQGSGLYVDSILECQGIIVKVRCLGCGGTGNIMCSECGGRGHL